MYYSRAIKRFFLGALLSSLFFTLLGCNRGFIKGRDMPYLIAQIYKADKYIGIMPHLQREVDTLRIYDAILKREGYTIEQFQGTLEHYLMRPTKLKEFYSKAQLLVTEELEWVTAQIERERVAIFLEKFFTKFIEDSTTLYFEVPMERALSWIGTPNSYPKWRFDFTDSLNALYETPKLSKWWSKSIENRGYSYKYIENNEENSSPLALPIEQNRPHKTRDGGVRRKREGIRG